MSSIIDSIRQQLGPDELAQIGQQLGTDAAATQRAIDAALPGLVGSMESMAQQPAAAADSGMRTLADTTPQALGGLGDLGSILGGAGGSGAGGGGLGGLGAILGGAGAGGLGGVLGSILGQRQPEVEHGVEKASGLDSGKTRQLLMILAPIVLSALARRGGGGGGGAKPGGGLGDILGRLG